MKKGIRMNKIGLACLAAILLCTGCERENPGFPVGGGQTGGPGSGPGSGIGYVDLGGSSLSVRLYASGEEIEHPTDGERTKALSRAEAGDLNDFRVNLVNARSGEVTRTYRYGDLGISPVEVPVGSYYVYIYSNEMKDIAWDGDQGQPTYGGRTSGTFEITTDHTADAPYVLRETVSCTLQSVKVSVTLEEGMAQLCSDDTQIEVILGTIGETVRSVTYDNDTPFGLARLNSSKQVDGAPVRESKNAYLAPVKTENALSIHLKTVYNGVLIDDIIPVVEAARAGEWRKIILYIVDEGSETGTIVIGSTVENWVYDEEVTVGVQRDTRTVLTESVIPDIDNPDAPVILPSGGSFSFHDKNLITDASYTDMVYNRPATFTVTTKSAIRRFAVRISTDNSSFAAILKNFGMLNTSIDMMQVSNQEQGNARSQLNTWGFPRQGEITDRTSLTVNLKGLMDYLYLYSGNHTVIVAVTDSEGYYSRIDLDLKRERGGSAGPGPGTDPAGEPTIVWPGRDIDQRYDVTDGMTVNVSVTVPAGIQEFLVDIEGELSGEVGSAGLPPHFSLVDPETSQPGLSDSLEELGFPTRNKVLNQTELTFDISKFVPLLKVFKGDSSFRMTVTDNQGRTVSKSIMLHVN